MLDYIYIKLPSRDLYIDGGKMMKLGIGQIRSINKKKSLKVNYYLSKQCLRGMLILFHNLIEKQKSLFRNS